jgi:hypothetical protein
VAAMEVGVAIVDEVKSPSSSQSWPESSAPSETPVPVIEILEHKAR